MEPTSSAVVDVSPESPRSDLGTGAIWGGERSFGVRDRDSSEASADVERNGSIGCDLSNHLAIARAAACEVIPDKRRSLYLSRFDFNDLDGSGAIDSPEEAVALVTSLWLELMAGPVARHGGDNQALMQAAIDELTANIEAGEMYTAESFALWFEHSIYRAHVPDDHSEECLSPIVSNNTSAEPNEEAAPCVICFERPIDCVLVPCGVTIT